MHLIQSLKNEFCFDLPLFSKYPATYINSYFYKMTLLDVFNGIPHPICLIEIYNQVGRLLAGLYGMRSSIKIPLFLTTVSNKFSCL